MSSSDPSDTAESPMEEKKRPGMGRPQSTVHRFTPVRSHTTRDTDYDFTDADGAVLAKLASEFPAAASQRTATTRTTTRPDELERTDTVAGMELTDPRLDPKDPAFDFFIWARMLMRLLEQDNIKTRRAGFTFKDLTVSGTGAALQLQQNVGSIFMVPVRFRETFLAHPPEKRILNKFNGTVHSGEMLVVLGRPGSGCTTFLKSICGELNGLDISRESVIHYNGIEQAIFTKELRGEIVYNQENEKHFPHLTVGQTLDFAAAARTPQRRVQGIARNLFAGHIAEVMMNIFGLSHTRNTKVGNDFVRGVSGGERKRVSIAEMALAGSPIAAWDNSTRGLDSATALEFVRSLRVASDIAGMTQAVAIYQASQSIYDIFDKAIVLYEGRQIYFGPAGAAKAYFETMGYWCPPRQTTGDFLTSVTNPLERKAKEGYEDRVPRTPDEFEKYWLQSEDCKACLREIKEAEDENPIGGGALEEFRESHHQMQAKHLRPKSPYVISVFMQVKICTKRAYQRLWNDKASTLSVVIGQIAQALIIGSIFYGTPNTTGSFFAKGSVLFFAVLLNALLSISEINGLYEQRPIVEKHASYAFYHPFTEAVAGIVSDIPVKFVVSTCFNVILYFLAGKRSPYS